MIILTKEVLESNEEYKKNLQLFKEGKIENFKSFSAFMGIYKEGPKETFMIRPRTPGGEITLEQLKGITEISRKYNTTLRFTTRQDFQIHSVKLDDIEFILDDLVKAGLTTKGAGGDSVRNVGCSPLSGVAREEVFDVTPYIMEICNYMLIDPTNLKLPRKYKISFSNTAEDTANATISDLGFIAKIQDGKRGFEVYGGGGLGTGAKVSIKISDFIPDTDALYYAQAMKQVFEREGDRTNRNKARIRFIVQRLGEEKFLEVFKEELEKVKQNENLKIEIPYSEKEDLQEGVEFNETLVASNKNVVFPQKQVGFYSVYLHPLNGNVSADQLEVLVKFIESLNYDITLRIPMTQGIFVRDVKEADVSRLLEETQGFYSNINLFNSISCVGPTICNFGINNSQGMLQDVIAQFKNESIEIQEALPRLQISGCYNSCGQHQKGLIGFTGKRKKTEDGTIPVYGLSFNGRVGVNPQLGQVYGDIPSRKMGAFLIALAKLKVESGILNFSEFVLKEDLKIKELVAQYSVLDTIAEYPELYVDFE